MLLKELHKMRFQYLRHKPMYAFLIIFVVFAFFDKTNANAENETQTPPTTTMEPDAAPGCRAPEIRFNVIKPDAPTERPYVKFEGSQVYSPEESPNGHLEHELERANADMAHANPYDVEHDDDEEVDEEDDGSVGTETSTGKNLHMNGNRKRGRGSSSRRRVENENGHMQGRGGRYRRHAIYHDPDASADTDKWSGIKLSADGDVYYARIDEILDSTSPNHELRAKLYKLKKSAKHKQKKYKNPKSIQAQNDFKANGNQTANNQHDIQKREMNAANSSNSYDAVRNACNENGNATVTKNCNSNVNTTTNQLANGKTTLQRVKRKSGKTTGALSRPKGGGDSSSKTTSRKDKGIYDDDGIYPPNVHPDEIDEDEDEEEEEEIDIQQQFTEVSEIRFPGEIGPLGDRRLCKIRCIKGKWIGPLCATNEEDESGNVKFQPLYKSCHVNRIPPHLLLSYRNISVTPIPSIRGSRRNRTSKPTFVSNTQINVGWDLPHGHSLQARCRDLGLYKLLGESRVLCSNGLWAPRMPSCVPTTLLTNFSDDSAPSIRIKVLNGSGAFEPSGVLAVLPQSTIYLDCVYPRLKGVPDWTWTSWYKTYVTGWSTVPEEKNLRYRLTIKDIQNNDSGTFTCTSPRGLTNSVTIVVATSTCPQLSEPVSPLTLRLEGNKLGQRALYRCPPGYQIDGSANATCLASGNWSSPTPTCQKVQCPRLTFDDPHLSLVELNTSAWGRARFKCQWGFKLTGPPGLECMPSGLWSGQIPRCKAIQCPMPIAPLNGRIGGSNLHQNRLTVGALVTFSCNEGHTLVGEQSIVCTESGMWTHPAPFCKSQCPYPGDPPNGLIAPLKFSYDSGDYLSVECRPGYITTYHGGESGPPERPKCNTDGTWSGSVPMCRSYEEV